ncbi:MAG: DUF4263 domain-containing protein [Polyangiales bacterium]
MVTGPKQPKVTVFDAKTPITENDVKELKDFLSGNATGDERALHRLLERHPALIGVLGFSEFASEQPLYKRDENNKPILDNPHRRDRADLIAAKTSVTLPSLNSSFYKSTHIIELKSAATKIAERDHGTRLSAEASHAVGQLRDYKEWLTTVPENRVMFEALGWDIRVPNRYLVMGTASEFANNPGHLEELRGRLLEDGVCLVTVDEVLWTADKQVQDRRLVIDIGNWMVSSGPTQSNPSSRILVQVEDFAFLHPTSIRFFRSPGPALPPSLEFFHVPRAMRQELLSHLRRDFSGLCAYCRTPDRMVGGIDAFGIDTFRPRARFPALALTYENLYYACRTCDAYKADRWPTDSEERSGVGFADPMDRFTDHFEEEEDLFWKPKHALRVFDRGVAVESRFPAVHASPFASNVHRAGVGRRLGSMQTHIGPNKPMLPIATNGLGTDSLRPLRRQTGQSLGRRMSGSELRRAMRGPRPMSDGRWTASDGLRTASGQ